MKRLYLPLLGLALQGGSLSAQEAPDQFPEEGAREENYRMRITARVIDEQGNPLPNTPIRIGIHNVNDYKDEYNDFQGKTDVDGKFSAEGMGRALAKIEVHKDGFYVSEKTVTCYEGTAEEIRKAGKFFPWDPVVDIIIKKVGKPIPMLVRRGSRCKNSIEPSTSQLGKEIGWDLVEGDWVPPYGQGTTADLIVLFESDFIDGSNRSSSVTVGFGNPNDGFIPITKLKGEASLLRYPRQAPKNGYDLQKIKYSRKVENDALTITPNENPEGYFIRLRSKMEENGQVKSAIYGKVIEPLRFQDNVFRGRSYLFLKFDYYLNLTPNDRNLEYDQKTNLAPEANRNLRWPL